MLCGVLHLTPSSGMFVTVWRCNSWSTQRCRYEKEDTSMGMSNVREFFRVLSRSIALARAYESGRLSIDDVRAAITEPIQAEASASPEPDADEQVAA